ncbi:hypothetical protein F2P81_025294 [Scophthalmus maximus]|uniref:Uncharacterized protein n=1 Tax=Scophthalmus maximus TaxID=52904 RepID=A0A6A4RTE2_SCOMX|nr:hypothetical protein F2P81_025294 [Scophthalmus maximus]
MLPAAHGASVGVGVGVGRVTGLTVLCAGLESAAAAVGHRVVVSWDPVFRCGSRKRRGDGFRLREEPLRDYVSLYI